MRDFDGLKQNIERYIYVLDSYSLDYISELDRQITDIQRDIYELHQNIKVELIRDSDPELYRLRKWYLQQPKHIREKLRLNRDIFCF